MLRATLTTRLLTALSASDVPEVAGTLGHSHFPEYTARGDFIDVSSRSGDAVRGAVTDSGGHDSAELFEIDRLGEVVKSAILERLHGILSRAVGRDDHAALRSALRLDLFQKVKPSPIGQAHVGDHGRKGVAVKQNPGFCHRCGSLDPIAFAQQRKLIQRSKIRLIVYDEDQGSKCRGRCSHVGALGRAPVGAACS